MGPPTCMTLQLDGILSGPHKTGLVWCHCWKVFDATNKLNQSNKVIVLSWGILLKKERELGVGLVKTRGKLEPIQADWAQLRLSLVSIFQDLPRWVRIRYSFLKKNLNSKSDLANTATPFACSLCGLFLLLSFPFAMIY
jgi:hypothetical protein